MITASITTDTTKQITTRTRDEAGYVGDLLADDGYELADAEYLIFTRGDESVQIVVDGYHVYGSNDGETFEYVATFNEAWEASGYMETQAKYAEVVTRQN